MQKYTAMGIKCIVSCDKKKFEEAESKIKGDKMHAGLETRVGAGYNVADVLNKMSCNDITFEDADEWEEFEMN